jgi:glycosyltransferase involved in cell wall biosynthesis
LRKKIALIVQRYGLEVNGGAEYHCRVIAEKLKDIYDVEVLTSCAKDYLSWKNEYAEGISIVNDITVRRFAVEESRNWKKFNSLSRELIGKRRLHQKALRLFGLLNAFEKLQPIDSIPKKEEEWVKCQGPNIPTLINYLTENHPKYDALIFFTYLYYPTVFGMDVASKKSILVPTAHDEPPIYLNIFKEFFNKPAAILYNTLSEQRFVNQQFHNEAIFSEIVGVGIDPPKGITPQSIDDIVKPGDPFLIYIGRVDPSKGCGILFDYFSAYKKASDSNLKLVVVGELFMDAPANPDIILTGFVADDIKTSLLLKARALVIPSLYESLSLVTLESMAYGVPVIANEKCEVLKDHINNSNAGFLFNDYDSFRNLLNTILDPDFNTTILSENAKKYVAENYSWPATIEKYKKAIDYISPR